MNGGIQQAERIRKAINDKYHSPFARKPAPVLLYRDGMTNFCPDCGGSQWIRGRTTAECASCGTALPLQAHDRLPDRPRFTCQSRRTAL